MTKTVQLYIFLNTFTGAGLSAFLSREMLPQPSSSGITRYSRVPRIAPVPTVRNGIRSGVLGIDGMAEQGLPVAVVVLGAHGLSVHVITAIAAQQFWHRVPLPG